MENFLEILKLILDISKISDSDYLAINKNTYEYYKKSDFNLIYYPATIHIFYGIPKKKLYKFIPFANYLNNLYFNINLVEINNLLSQASFDLVQNIRLNFKFLAQSNNSNQQLSKIKSEIINILKLIKNFEFKLEKTGNIEDYRNNLYKFCENLNLNFQNILDQINILEILTTENTYLLINYLDELNILPNSDKPNYFNNISDILTKKITKTKCDNIPDIQKNFIKNIKLNLTDQVDILYEFIINNQKYNGGLKSKLINFLNSDYIIILEFELKNINNNNFEKFKLKYEKYKNNLIYILAKINKSVSKNSLEIKINYLAQIWNPKTRNNFLKNIELPESPDILSDFGLLKNIGLEYNLDELLIALNNYNKNINKNYINKLGIKREIILSDIQENLFQPEIKLNPDQELILRSNLDKILVFRPDHYNMEFGDIKFYPSNTIIFTIKNIPKIIFKLVNPENRERFRKTIFGKKIIEKYNFKSLVIPKIGLVKLDKFEFILEELLDINPTDSGQEYLYWENSDYLESAILELTQFILLTGLTDISWRNIPKINNILKIGLIDLNELNCPTDGIFGGPGNRQGLICCVNSKYSDLIFSEYKKTIYITEPNQLNNLYLNSVTKRKKYEFEYQDLKKFYKSKLIISGFENIYFDITELILPENISHKIFNNFLEYIIFLVDEINFQINKNKINPDESVRGKRQIFIYTKRKYNNWLKFYDMAYLYPQADLEYNKNMPGYSNKFKSYLETIIEELIRIKIIYNIILKNSHGYIIQV